MTSHYEILDIPPDASRKEIRDAYRKKAQKEHPDKGGNEERFQKLSKANRVLSNPESRAHYDRTGDDAAPNTNAEAENNISVMLVNICNDPKVDPDTVNIIKIMRDCTTENMEKVNDQIGADRKQIKKLNKAKKRLRWKRASKDSPLARFLDHQAGDIRRRIESGRSQLKICEKMLELISEYEYEYEEPPPRVMGGIRFTGTEEARW